MKTMIKNAAFMVIALLSVVSIAVAHDGWVQSNVAKVRNGDMIYLDLQFGNHGNTHRDYKIWASKWDINKASFQIVTPKGNSINLKDSVVDIGNDETKIVGNTTYVDKNGYLVAKFHSDHKEIGLYCADIRQDVVVSYAPERSIKGAKAMIAALPSTMSNYSPFLQGYDRVLGQPLEIIPLSNPTDLAVGDTLTVQVLFKGAPLADACLSVIPRGKTLPAMGVENPYDLMTDMSGKASFTFDEANYHLFAVHQDTAEGGTLEGKPYSQTKYTGALTVIVNPHK